MNSRVLLTGGSGFLGSACLSELRSARPTLGLRVLDVVPPRGGLGDVVLGDVRDPRAVEEAMVGVSVVIHLASCVGVSETDNNPELCTDVLVRGTRSVLEAAGRAGVRRVVFISSSEVYGEAGLEPLHEDASLAPCSAYGLAKVRAERLVAEHPIDWAILRPFNLYGPNQRAPFVVPRFIEAAARGAPPVVYGDGTQTRTFCHVSDAARAVRLAAFAKGASKQVINVGNPREPIRIRELAERIARLADPRMEPRFIPFTEADRPIERDVRRRVPDTRRATDLLGFTASIDLARGLSDLWAGAVRTYERGQAAAMTS